MGNARIYYNVIAKKKIFVFMLFIVILVSAFFWYKFKRNQDLKREEIVQMKQYLETEWGYSIKEIPTWVSLAPMSKSKKLSFPKYVIQPDGLNEMDQDKLIYYYPFANRAKAEECYNLLSLEEKECCDLISFSLIYSSERTQEYIKLIENMKQYFEPTEKAEEIESDPVLINH